LFHKGIGALWWSVNKLSDRARRTQREIFF
jgi:hypothetical protein